MTLEEYDALPRNERIHLRRTAFGAYGEVPAELQELRQLLLERNEREGWFPMRWVDECSED